ncbi:hypothetical protein ACFY9N_00965 [Microbacterium sp. NPDC008134]|uniref:hypothetical protein n=1 Tax=Microbacterium sp. NPDC008134 TaxID=3364183 RepID=UPI0036EA8490
MADRFTLDEAGYILYSEMLERLRERFPTVPLWRLEQIAAAENDAITGGLLRIVPAEVETGVIEMLESEQTIAGDDEVVA